MTPEQITAITKETLFMALQIATPFLLIVLIIGLLISILQSLTRVQEITLSFVPKMIILTLALTLAFPWILKMMTKFTHHILIDQWDKIITVLHHGS